MAIFTDWLSEHLSKIIKQLSNDYVNDLEIQQNKIIIDYSKNPKFGNFTTNWILTLGIDNQKALNFAEYIASNAKHKYLSKIEAVKPGFLNFSLSPLATKKILNEILTKKNKYGNDKQKRKIIEIEFVSANPTGLLHIGHARNAAIGDSLARILESQGHKIIREYYINDAGNQIDKLALSVLIRYKELFGINDKLPEDSYHGEEVVDLAKLIREKYNDKFLNLNHDNNKIITSNTENRKAYNLIKKVSKSYMLNCIKKSLNNFGVKFDIWFSESYLYKHHLIENVLKILKPYTYVKDKALWLATNKRGDDKDRVLIKSDKSYTYFLPDIAYHVIKMSHNYHTLFNVWGADHKSYVNRMKIALDFCGFDSNKIKFIIMQMVRLTKDGKEFKMSKRSGQSLTLNDLLNSIGKDAARWYMVSQPSESHLEIDVDKAQSKDNNNSLYYVLYAHARCHQIFKKTNCKIAKNFKDLTSNEEIEIISLLAYYPNTLRTITTNYSINILTVYLTNLARLFHSYYAKVQIIDKNNHNLTSQRLAIVKATQQVLSNGLKLLGIDPVEKM